MPTRTFPVSEALRRTPYNFPDAPPKEDLNDYLYLAVPGYPPALIRHLGNRDTTAVMAGIYISRNLPRTQSGLFYPDLVIAFDVDMEAILARKGFVINEQGKPPDFVLEVGSDTTWRRDVGIKREGYATLGIPEYWRFDPSSGRRPRRDALAGDRLVNGQYEPMPIYRTDDGDYRGYSPILSLELRWESGRLLWYSPAEQHYLPSYEANEAQRIAAEEQRDAAEEQRDIALAQRDAAEEQRDIALAQRDTDAERIRQLEEQLRRQQNLG